MALVASDIITRVRELLVDEQDTKRWTDAELLRHLSDGQQAIAGIERDACTTRVSFELDVGTLQELPERGLQLLNITRNMGSDGTQPGRAIRLILREILDAQDPNWHTATKQSVIQNYIYDPLDPTHFYVYPPSNGASYIEIFYAYMPSAVTTLVQTLDLTEEYLTPLLDYVMYRALQKDSDFAAGMQRATAHFSAFQMYLGARTANELEVSPNQQATPFNPGVKGAAK